MKYIKKFEAGNLAKMFWLIPTDDRLHDSLDKIHNENGYKPPNRYYNDPFYKYYFKYLYLGVDHNTFDLWTDKYTAWSYIDFKEGPESFIKDDYKFMGNVNVSEEELNMIKFNL